MWGLMVVLGLVTGILNEKIITYFCEGEKTNKILIVLLTACIFGGAYTLLGVSLEMIWTLIIWNVLLVIAIIDGYTHFIVDAMVYALGLVVLVGQLVSGASFYSAIYGGVFGFVFYAIIYFAAKAYYKKEAFGFGDVMLMGVSGLYLGWPLTVLTAFAAFYLALFGVIVQFIRHRKEAFKQVIAFGPYICLATVLSSIWGQKILDWYMGGLLF